MRAIALLLFILLIDLSSTAVADEEKFKVCSDPLNPPYSTNKLDGFENKIAELFAKELGQKVEYTWFPQRIGFIRNTLTAPVDENAVDSNEFKCDVVMGVPDGFDMVSTTRPYYQSTFVLLIAKGRGFDEIKEVSQLANLPLQQQEKLKIAMFDRGPGTAWLEKIGLLDQGIPYQSMSGDNENNIAMQLAKDFKAKKIDMAILWGPIAGYLVSESNQNSFTVIPMQSNYGIQFAFAMSMGVRRGDKERKDMLNRLITAKKKEIHAILESYHVPLTEIKQKPARDDDD